MNKELIKKFKTEFNHYINEGKLLYYSEVDGPYYDVSDETWNFACDIGIIINDEFVEFRKAISEGKTIQIYTCIEQHPHDPSLDEYGWRDFKSFKPNSSFINSIENYRIKPELNIKVGDWVILNDQYYKVRQVEPQWEYVYTEDGRQIWKSFLSVWRPKPAEWCIMDTTNNDQAYSFTVQQWQEDSKWIPAPYTGPLPYFIKE